MNGEIKGKYHPVRQGLHVYHLRHDLSVEQVRKILAQPGDIIKRSRKSVVRRVGPWIIKESRRNLIGLLKHTFQRDRYRQAWNAALYLRHHSIDVPEPVAFIETGLGGVIGGNTLIAQYLEWHRNVEQFLLALVQRGGGKDTIALFLERLADAVNRLRTAGAYHADLSGKNIFTRDGVHFYFIDLDSVILNAEYTEERCMKNMVQLYDSFCDLLNDAMLVPFIGRMLGPEHDLRLWMPRIRKAQQKRRLMAERRLEKQGKTRRPLWTSADDQNHP